MLTDSTSGIYRDSASSVNRPLSRKTTWQVCQLMLSSALISSYEPLSFNRGFFEYVGSVSVQQG